MRTEVDFFAGEIKQLIGFTIVDVVVTKDKESWGFIVERQPVPGVSKLAEKICWVDCDPEGNGPGFIKVEEAPK